MRARTHTHPLLGHLALSGHIFDYSTMGVAPWCYGIYCVEAGSTTHHLTGHRAAPTQQV